MNVVLYNISDPPNKIKKSIGSGTTIENVRFLDDDALSITTPTILLKLNDDVENNIPYNYVYIPKLHRYYFITEISFRAGLTYISCKCDVLYTFSKDILASEQYVARSQTNQNRYLVDDMLPIHSDKSYDVIPFTDEVFDKNCSHVILETTGTGGNV